MTVDPNFWKQHTHLHIGNLLALLAVGMAQVTILFLLIGQDAVTPAGLVVRGMTLILLPFLAIFFASRLAAYTTNRLQLTLLANLVQSATLDLEQLHAHTFSKSATIDADHLYQFWRDLFVNVCVNLPVLLCLTYWLWTKSSLLFLAGLGALLVILVGFTYVINNQIKRKHSEHHQVYLDLQDQISNYIANIFQFRLYRREQRYVHAIGNKLTQFSRLTANLSQHRQVNATYVSSVMLLLLWGGLWLFQSQQPMTPELVAVVTIVFLEIRRIGTDLFTTIQSYLRAKESAAILRQWLVEPATNNSREISLLPVVPITVENLIFQYEKDLEPIAYPDLSMAVGEKVWIKGPNGRGKSTLWKILTGLYASSGTPVKLNDRPKPSNERTPFWGRMSVVTEPARCYSGLLWEIIGNFSASRQEVYAWLDAHLLLDLFESYPTQLDTYYDSAVNNLSAGQLKWLLLVQAFYLAPDFLVLDEPFSSLDIQRQQRTLQLLKALPSATTVLVISHHDLPISFDKIISL